MANNRTEPRYLAVARIVRPWGLRGELKAEILTQDPDRFEKLETLYVGPRFEPHSLERVRRHKSAVRLKLAGFDDRDAAESLRGLMVYVSMEDALPLEEGEYWIHQIMGLEVWSESGERLGVVQEVLETLANDVYVVRGGGQELLVPALDDVVLEIDLDEGWMVVNLPEGLV